MDNFTPDESQLKALATWYSKDSPLHFDSRHPCIKLAGECGELLDAFAKNEYKPNFSWWVCKMCSFMPADKKRSETDYYAFTCMNGKEHTPLVLDELGDISYYLRILAYQKGVTFEALCSEFEKYLDYYVKDDLLKLLTCLMDSSSTVLNDFVHDEVIELGHLQYCAYFFLAILHKLDCSLSHLLDLNYKKLNSEVTNHGWANATIKSRM